MASTVLPQSGLCSVTKEEVWKGLPWPGACLGSGQEHRPRQVHCCPTWSTWPACSVRTCPALALVLQHLGPWHCGAGPHAVSVSRVPISVQMCLGWQGPASQNCCPHCPQGLMALILTASHGCCRPSRLPLWRGHGVRSRLLPVVWPTQLSLQGGWDQASLVRVSGKEAPPYSACRARRLVGDPGSGPGSPSSRRTRALAGGLLGSRLECWQAGMWTGHPHPLTPMGAVRMLRKKPTRQRWPLSPAQV